MIIIKSIELLETQRLKLRKFQINDAESLFNNWGTDSEITKYMLWKNYKTIDDAINNINYYIECYENNSNFRQYAIELKDTKELIGQISFTINKKHESAEIAYLIARPYQNKGLMKEALIAVINYLINDLNCTRISAEVMIENIPSIRLLEKCGFVQEGIEKLKYKKKDGKFTDSVIMSMIDDKRLYNS